MKQKVLCRQSKQVRAVASTKREQGDACITPDERERARRHSNMAAIRSKDTKPEMIVRRGLWSRGFRYRLNDRRLPGHPDLVLRKYRTCTFVNGCFWHGHRCSPKPYPLTPSSTGEGEAYGSEGRMDLESSECCKIPKTNREFWVKKITRNKERDKEEQRRLAEMGWHCITVWECELKPSKREETLDSIAFTLNHIWLQDHQAKVVPYPELEEENAQMPMAAEERPMKRIEVVAAIIHDDKGRIFATQRGYGEWKDWWEFPGGKMEPGEAPEEALKREIWEELETGIVIERLVQTVEYDYPKFHLTMHCFWCHVESGLITLKEHEAARWLTGEQLDSVEWLPADKIVIEKLYRYI